MLAAIMVACSAMIVVIGRAATADALLNVLIDQMAPGHLKGSYFGAASISGLGVAMGALLGGWVLAHWGGSWLYALMALLCLVILMLYGLSTRTSRPALVRAGP